jgi:hypothetical protein
MCPLGEERRWTADQGVVFHYFIEGDWGGFMGEDMVGDSPPVNHGILVLYDVDGGGGSGLGPSMCVCVVEGDCE